MSNDDITSGATESVCPVCLDRIAATRVRVGEDVYLEKTCPSHGSFRTIIWRGAPSYSSWSVSRPVSQPPVCAASVDRGCPFDCGLCPEHRQQTCCVLIEITSRCNLRCPVCFAEAGSPDTGDPDMGTIESWFRMLMESGGPYNIQLSGGEPTLRDDVPEIIKIGRSLGFTFFQLNTNGLRLAEDAGYAKSLKKAGLGCVFLQFDGTTDMVYEMIRGKALLDIKKTAIEHCRDNRIGVVLVPTLVPGINTNDIGRIIDYAVSLVPTVRGVHFQPVSYFGRYPSAPSDSARITLPEVMTEIERQTSGRIKRDNLHPPAAENSHCSFNGNFVLMENGELRPMRKEGQSCCCQPQPAAEGAKKAQLFVAKKWALSLKDEAAPASTEKMDARAWMKTDSMDAFLDRVENYSFCVSAMAFQDAWNIDLERLRECFIHVVSPDNRIIPFCSYNLTGIDGNPLHRRHVRCR